MIRKFLDWLDDYSEYSEEQQKVFKEGDYCLPAENDWLKIVLVVALVFFCVVLGYASIGF